MNFKDFNSEINFENTIINNYTSTELKIFNVYTTDFTECNIDKLAKYLGIQYLCKYLKLSIDDLSKINCVISGGKIFYIYYYIYEFLNKIILSFVSLDELVEKSIEYLDKNITNNNMDIDIFIDDESVIEKIKNKYSLETALIKQNKITKYSNLKILDVCSLHVFDTQNLHLQFILVSNTIDSILSFDLVILMNAIKFGNEIEVFTFNDILKVKSNNPFKLRDIAIFFNPNNKQKVLLNRLDKWINRFKVLYKNLEHETTRHILYRNKIAFDNRNLKNSFTFWNEIISKKCSSVNDIHTLFNKIIDKFPNDDNNFINHLSALSVNGNSIVNIKYNNFKIVTFLNSKNYVNNLEQLLNSLYEFYFKNNKNLIENVMTIRNISSAEDLPKLISFNGVNIYEIIYNDFNKDFPRIIKTIETFEFKHNCKLILRCFNNKYTFSLRNILSLKQNQINIINDII